MSPVAFALLAGIVGRLGGYVQDTLLEDASIGSALLRATFSGVVLVVILLPLYSLLALSFFRLARVGGDFTTTYRCFAWSTAALGLSWIPVVGPVAAEIWFWVLVFKSTRAMLDVKRLPSFLAPLVPMTLLALPIHWASFVYEAVKIPSGAMLPSFWIDDHVYVDTTAYWRART